MVKECKKHNTKWDVEDCANMKYITTTHHETTRAVSFITPALWWDPRPNTHGTNFTLVDITKF